MAAKPFFLRVQHAASEAENFDGDTKHVVLVMAAYANCRTGVGWHSQATIARLSSRSERRVRGVLAALSHKDSTPVRVERRARFRSDGRGRTSDEWRLILVNDQPAQGAAYSQDQPAQPAGMDSGLTGTTDTTNRHHKSDQPAPGAGDLRSDRRSDRRSIVAATADDIKKPRRAARIAKKAAPISIDWQPTDEHRAFAIENGLDLALEAKGFRGYYDGQPVKSPNGRFTTWLTNQVKWRRERAGKGRREVQGGAGDVARLAEQSARIRAQRGQPSLLEDGE